MTDLCGVIDFLYIEILSTMTPKDQHKTIKDSYLIAFDDSKTIKERKLGARNVVSTIVENVFFENHKIYEAFISVNNDIVEGTASKRKYPYVTSFKSRLEFLCDYGHIQPSLRSEYVFIYSEAGMHSTAHLAFKEGEKRLIHVIKIFLNEILESFLSNSEGDKSFLVPMNVIEQDDPKFHKRMMGRIDTFWNSENRQLGFKRYGTTALYALGLVTTFLLPIVSVLIAVFGILNTHKYVFNKKVKALRYIVFICFALTSISLMGYNSYRHNKYEKEGTSFDMGITDKGFLVLSETKDFHTDSLKKSIGLKDLKKGEQKDFYLFHLYRNNGIRDMSASASLQISEQDNQILLVGNLTSNNAVHVADTTSILNIKRPYHIQFMDGLMVNEQGRFNIVNCEKHLYKKIVFEKFYINRNENNANTYIGTPLGELGVYNDGWCDAGYIVSRFRITKL
ncbi:hypothetical protein [Yeosuana marina]|uniref:hypothetical protein n=1 Tax=Yeosuana marina TaxID=1565536 RepID=UPI0030C80CCD